MTLIKTFSPHPDESGRGYYRRLSSANVMSSWKDLARHCASRINFDALLANPLPVAQTLGLSPEWCTQATQQDDIARTWRGLRRHRHDAVCIHCLRESAHLRTLWEHAYCVACPAHGALLRDTCPACSSPLRFEREHLEFCDCGFDLRGSTPQAATPAQLWVSSLLANGNAAVDGFGPALNSTSLDVAAKLITTLCKQADPKVAARRANAPAPSTIEQLIAFFEPLEHLLANWPANFKGHISERLRVGPVEGRTLNKRLGTWYQQFRKLSEHEASHPFLSVIGQVAEVEFDGVLGLDAAAKVINKQASHVLLLEAATRIGISHSALTNHRTKGALKCKAIPSGTNGMVYQVAVSEVNAIIQARQGWTTDAEACAMLGVPHSVLERLCEAGAVVRDVRWKDDLRKGGPIELASLHRFAERLRSSVMPGEEGEGRRIKLCELSARYVGDKKALLCALQAIAAGTICAVKAGQVLGDYEYLWDDVAKHYARPVLDQGLTIQGLSEATGYKHETISQWIGQGLLKSFDVLQRGQPCRVVTPTQFYEFRREYVPVSDLAKELCTKSSALMPLLKGLEVLGFQELAGGARRGGVVRMRDLARAAIRNLVNT